MSQKIQQRRGTKALLPALDVGEFGFTTDTKELFIGATGGNVEFASILSGGYKIQSGAATIVTNAAAGVYSANITFPIAFDSMPVIAPGTFSTSPQLISAATFGNLSKTGFTIYINQTDATAKSIGVHWIAIG